MHAGGAISGEGARVAPVLLSGPLARYDLPAPIRDAARIRESFLAHSGSMLTQFPSRVSATLLGHVYRSALGPNPWVLLIVGSPGSYKTSLTSIAMHHWGGSCGIGGGQRRPCRVMETLSTPFGLN